MVFRDLETQRLQLKLVGLEDRTFLYQMYAGPVTTQRLFDAQPLRSLEDADRVIQQFSSGDSNNYVSLWILIRRDNGAKIGICGFRHWDIQDGSVEVDCDLDAASRHRGFMYEALHELIQFATSDMQLRSIYANIYARNSASRNIASKLGFQPAGKSTFSFQGKEYPALLYVLELS